MKYYFYLFFTVLLLGTISNCSDDIPSREVLDYHQLSNSLKLPFYPFEYNKISLPDFFNNQFITIQNNTPDDNPTTNWGATLGRVLFYDKLLSMNHQIACASCHIQQFGFSDTAMFSRGFLGGHTKRHSMGLVNSKYYANGHFFWDERASTLEQQVLMPILDSVEMGMRMDTLIKRLNSKSHYTILFEKAFGDKSIDDKKIARALAQFVRSLVSYRSKYDEGRKAVAHDSIPFSNFTKAENEGKKVFMTAKPIPCSGCHFTSLFIMDNPRNNGVLSSDPGLMNSTGMQDDFGKFKVPSLKNISIRPPYMHDGSMKTIDEVIEHYSTGIFNVKNLDVHLQVNGQAAQYNFTEDEKRSLKAFLNTLTDIPLSNDEKYSNPFK